MEKFFKELQAIEERFLPADQVKDEKDISTEDGESSDLADAGNYSVDGDVLSQEVEEIEAASAEDVNDSLFMLFQVIGTCAERIRIILDKSDEEGIVDEEILKMAEDAEDLLEEIANEIEERLENSELSGEEENEEEVDEADEEASEEEAEEAEEEAQGAGEEVEGEETTEDEESEEGEETNR